MNKEYKVSLTFNCIGENLTLGDLKKKVAEFLGINSNQLYPSMKIIFMEKKLKNNRKT